MNGVQTLRLWVTVSRLLWLQLGLAQPRGTGRHGKDSVTEALEYVQDIANQEGKCAVGPTLDLDYNKERWTTEAAVAVRAANLLTLLSRTGSHIHGKDDEDEDLLYSIVIGNVDNNPTVFGSGIAFDSFLFRDYEVFLPYAFRKPEGLTEAKDVSTTFNYLITKAEWFYPTYLTYKNYSLGSNYTFLRYPNGSDTSEARVALQDGYWTKPYFDCGGGEVWMVTFTVPFFIPVPHVSPSFQSFELIFG